MIPLRGIKGGQMEVGLEGRVETWVTRAEVWVEGPTDGEMDGRRERRREG